jgi:hypothetical protein
MSMVIHLILNSKLLNIDQTSEFNGWNFDEVEIVSEKLKHSHCTEVIHKLVLSKWNNYHNNG